MATIPQEAPQTVVSGPPGAIPQEPAYQNEVRLYAHSTIFYWWPVWATGYLMAFLTYIQGTGVSIKGQPEELFHPSKNLGVIFTFVFLAVILITNVSLRGKSAVITILTM